jgi:hypothetical protein
MAAEQHRRFLEDAPTTEAKATTKRLSRALEGPDASRERH